MPARSAVTRRLWLRVTAVAVIAATVTLSDSCVRRVAVGLREAAIKSAAKKRHQAVRKSPVTRPPDGPTDGGTKDSK